MSVCTGEPEVLDPEKILTMIVEESPAAVPAAPENAGLLLLSVLPFAGLVNVTAGAFVLIVKVLGVLTPVLPALSDCCACAV